MVSFCEDSLIGGSNIHVKKGVPFGIDWFPTLIKLHFRYAYYVW